MRLARRPAWVQRRVRGGPGNNYVAIIIIIFFIIIIVVRDDDNNCDVYGTILLCSSAKPTRDRQTLRNALSKEING